MRIEAQRRALQTATAHDLVVCQRLLSQVSRTFALSIEALPDDLRRSVRVAYLLCRIVDNIEDATGISSANRQRLFDLFDAALTSDEVSPEALERGFRSMTGDAGGLSTAEKLLGGRAGCVFRVFRSLIPQDREAIRPHVLEMSRGMRGFSVRTPAAWGGFAIEDLQDLELYCYFVAGTVGQLLTALFARYVGLSNLSRDSELQQQAISFGIGLQLVNIVKDVADDFHRRACFLPMDLALEQGLDLRRLLDPLQRAAGLRVIHRITARARHHLEIALQYTQSWPLPQGEPVRLFCAVPLVLALATLDEVEHGDDTLRPGRCPAVTRDTVRTLWSQAHQAVRSEKGLRRWLQARAMTSNPSPLSGKASILTGSAPG